MHKLVKSKSRQVASGNDRGLRKTLFVIFEAGAFIKMSGKLFLDKYFAYSYVFVLTCMCSAHFANLHNFEIALRKLEIVQLLSDFEIALPLLPIFEIVQERTNNLFFFVAGMQCTSFRLRRE